LTKSVNGYSNNLIYTLLKKLCRKVTVQVCVTVFFRSCASYCNVTGGKTMEITDVKIRKIMTDGRLRAVVSVTIDDMLAVHDIKVVQGDERLFVAMPSRKDENGVFRDIVHPIAASSRKLIEETILEAYEKQLLMLEAEGDEEAETTDEV